MEKHSLLPWEAEVGNPSFNIMYHGSDRPSEKGGGWRIKAVQSSSASGFKTVCQGTWTDTDRDEELSNISFILKAVNNHQILIDALIKLSKGNRSPGVKKIAQDALDALK